MTAEAIDLEDDGGQQGQLVPYRVRAYRGESAFVAATWLRSYQSAPFPRKVDSDDYYHAQARLVRKLIDRSTVLIAQHADLPDVYLGHVVGERDERGIVLHYLYVKGDYRRIGVGRALWTGLFDSLRRRDSDVVRYTHSRSPFSEIAARQGWTHNPYLAFRYGWEG